MRNSWNESWINFEKNSQWNSFRNFRRNFWLHVWKNYRWNSRRSLPGNSWGIFKTLKKLLEKYSKKKNSWRYSPRNSRKSMKQNCWRNWKYNSCFNSRWKSGGVLQGTSGENSNDTQWHNEGIEKLASKKTQRNYWEKIWNNFLLSFP